MTRAGNNPRKSGAQRRKNTDAAPRTKDRQRRGRRHYTPAVELTEREKELGRLYRDLS